MVHDLSVGLHEGLCVEGRLSIQHLVHADAQGPPVTLGAVLAHAVLHGLQDLGRDVVRGAHGHRGLDLEGEGVGGKSWGSSDSKFPTTPSKTLIANDEITVE